VPLAKKYDFLPADPLRPMPARNKVVATLAAGLRAGAHVAWWDQVYPMSSKALLMPEAVGIVGALSLRRRCKFERRTQARSSLAHRGQDTPQRRGYRHRHPREPTRDWATQSQLSRAAAAQEP
jgi:hypothetical protein